MYIKRLFGIFSKLNRERGITIVLITHYMDEAVKADRVIVMDDGKILTDGTPKEVFSLVDDTIIQIANLALVDDLDAFLQVHREQQMSRQSVARTARQNAEGSIGVNQ